eukprot:scaffold218582_cov31-Tisochrysis_lutea.AAC.5
MGRSRGFGSRFKSFIEDGLDAPVQIRRERTAQLGIKDGTFGFEAVHPDTKLVAECGQWIAALHAHEHSSAQLDGDARVVNN